MPRGATSRCRAAATSRCCAAATSRCRAAPPSSPAIPRREQEPRRALKPLLRQCARASATHADHASRSTTVAKTAVARELAGFLWTTVTDQPPAIKVVNRDTCSSSASSRSATSATRLKGARRRHRRKLAQWALRDLPSRRSPTGTDAPVAFDRDQLGLTGTAAIARSRMSMTSTPRTCPATARVRPRSREPRRRRRSQQHHDQRYVLAGSMRRRRSASFCSRLKARSRASGRCSPTSDDPPAGRRCNPERSRSSDARPAGQTAGRRSRCSFSCAALTSTCCSRLWSSGSPTEEIAPLASDLWDRFHPGRGACRPRCCDYGPPVPRFRGRSGRPGILLRGWDSNPQPFG